MNVPDAPVLPILLSQETGFSEQQDYAPRNLRVEMKEIGRVMTGQVKEVFVRIDIFLAALWAEFSRYFGSAIQAVSLRSVLLCHRGRL